VRISLTRVDLGVAVVVALGFIAASSIDPIARCLSPGYVTWRDFPLQKAIRVDPRDWKLPLRGVIGLAPHDGWDRPYRYTLVNDEVEVYSTGPDGIDQACRGDDIFLDPSHDPYANLDEWASGVRLVAIYLACAWALGRLARARRSTSLLRELSIALGLSAVAAGLVLRYFHSADPELLAIFAPIRPFVGLPPIASAAAVVAAVVFVATIALRHRRAIELGAGGERVSRRTLLVLAFLVSTVALAVGASSLAWARRQARLPRERVLTAAQLGVIWDVEVGDDLENPDAVRALLAQPRGAIDFSSFPPRALECIATVGSEALPAMIDALAVGERSTASSNWVAWNFVCRHDPRFEAVTRAVREDPRRYRYLVLKDVVSFAAAAGRPVTLALLVSLLDDRRSVYSDHEISDPRVHIPRTCDCAREDIEKLLGPEHNFGPPCNSSPPGDHEPCDQAVERARAWWRSGGRDQQLQAVGWLAIHATEAVSWDSQVHIGRKGEPGGSRIRLQGGENFFAAGPFSAGEQIEVKLCFRELWKTVALDFTTPAERTVWLEVDFSAGTVRELTDR
jgi:hypothetical protein